MCLDYIRYAKKGIMNEDWLRSFVKLSAVIKSLEEMGGMASMAWRYLQLPIRQWGASNVYLLVLSSWKVNIAENPIAVMGL